jgi:mono/diheme cytochrome c family protein
MRIQAIKKTFLVLILGGLLLTAHAAQAFWAPPAEADQIKNPMPADSSSTQNGKKLFEKNCVVCHGKQGKGDGASSLSLGVTPADLTVKEMQSQTDGAIFWKISIGTSHMPNWELVLTDKERWDLVNFIRSLSKQ